jgi:hypothetical protein
MKDTAAANQNLQFFKKKKTFSAQEALKKKVLFELMAGLRDFKI